VQCTSINIFYITHTHAHTPFVYYNINIECYDMKLFIIKLFNFMLPSKQNIAYFSIYQFAIYINIYILKEIK